VVKVWCASIAASPDILDSAGATEVGIDIAEGIRRPRRMMRIDFHLDVEPYMAGESAFANDGSLCSENSARPPR
jgi:hypothetical protein